MRKTSHQSKPGASKASKMETAHKLVHRQLVLIETSVTSILEQMHLVQEIESLGEVAPTNLTALLCELHLLDVEFNQLIDITNLLNTMHPNSN
jgi:hypothetical protein